MYRIVKFINESENSEAEKSNYVGILKAQLSSYELVLLLYNGLSDHGEKFYKLIRQYNLLDNINIDLLPAKGDIEYYK
jgi:hypothetical protein